MRTKAIILFALLISALLFSCHIGNEKTGENNLTYNQEIAPIIYKNCTPCHRPGSGAPFDLITFDDVKNHLKTVQLAINERLMPPWPADTSYSHFRDEKVMTAEEIKLVNEWIKQGAKEGEAGSLVPPPQFPGGSSFGKPDLTIKMKPYSIKGDNLDNFIMVKVPFTLASDTFVKAIEIIPGNKKLVHHVNAHLVQYAEDAKANYSDGADFVNTEIHDKHSAYQLLKLANDDGTYPLLTPSVSNYLPGVEPALYPEGIGGYHLKKNSALLLDNIHYGPSPIDTSDESTFNFFFDTKAPVRPTADFILGTSGISPIIPPLVVPPNEIKSFRTHYVLPEAISLLTVNPHMHLLGKSFKAYAITPQKDTINIIHIPKWDFRWQYFYTFKQMLKLPAGTDLIVEGVFDNTVNNPLNPFNPPRTVSERDGSMRTTDEMFQLICTFIPYKNGDEFISLDRK